MFGNSKNKTTQDVKHAIKIELLVFDVMIPPYEHTLKSNEDEKIEKVIY